MQSIAEALKIMFKPHVFFVALVVFAWASYLQAGQLSASLKPQIELLPHCIINDQWYSQLATGLDYGNLDFGEHAASFTGSLNATLSNANQNKIKIQCSNNAAVTLIFGAGLHDQQVPSNSKSTYFHALNSGSDYIAYNLLYGADKHLLHPLESIQFVGGATFEVDLYAQAYLSGQRISAGEYSDTIAITIEF